ncbi:FAD-binding oxidoreductase [Agromyces sp. MMS24-K17]|uniref:FAD-binding oxidoreductase n=1 Tax=Agromyces sp. MMS24-K17 TaxID=3372850 RepID=UPI0037550F8F
MSDASDPAALERLRTTISGSIVLPGDAGYDEARRAWNLAVDQRPAAIATPLDVHEVQALVRSAAGHGLRVTTQPNGHGASGSLEGVLVIRPTHLDEITVDRQTRMLRVGAGVNWGRALSELDGSGLIALAGSNPEVNAVALALNGGHSMFSRRSGLTARSVVSAELVDASGAVHWLADADDRDLLWALRGGGGAFGVVTSIQFALYQGDRLFGGSLAFPAEVAADVITAAFDLARDEPELGIDTGMARFPDIPLVPPPLRGQTVATVALVHVGDEAAGRRHADRLRAVAEPIADTLTAFTIGSLAAVAAEPVDPMPTADFGGAIGGGDAAFAHDFVAAFLAGAEHGLMRCGLRVLGGAVADELGAEFAAVGALHAPLLLNAGALLFDPSVDPAAAFEPLERLVAAYPPEGGGVPSFLGSGASFADAYGPETIARLEDVKRRVDPDGVFVANRPFRAAP